MANIDHEQSTRIILLTAESRLPGERSIVRLLKEEGFAVTVIRDSDELENTLTLGECHHTIVVAEHWTAHRGEGIDAYWQFLRMYASMRKSRKIDLMMITWRAQDSDVICGAGDLVTTYMTIPVDPKLMLTFIHRMIQNSIDRPPQHK